MDIATQRSQAYALIDALPQDSLEIVLLLMRKLAGNVQLPQGDEPSHAAEQSKEEAIAELRSLCHPGKHVWTEDPADYIRRMRDEDRL